MIIKAMNNKDKYISNTNINNSDKGHDERYDTIIIYTIKTELYNYDANMLNIEHYVKILFKIFGNNEELNNNIIILKQDENRIIQLKLKRTIGE